MRELKFRVWNERYNEFIRPDYGLIGFCYPLDGRIAVLTTSGEQMVDCIIEQYTGLKDKNGKEIYEGDIILVDNRYYSKYIVVYREWDCSFIGENDDREEIIHICNKTPQRYEVIGNIHENPELIGGK